MDLGSQIEEAFSSGLVAAGLSFVAAIVSVLALIVNLRVTRWQTKTAREATLFAATIAIARELLERSIPLTDDLIARRDFGRPFWASTKERSEQMLLFHRAVMMAAIFLPEAVGDKGFALWNTCNEFYQSIENEQSGLPIGQEEACDEAIRGLSTLCELLQSWLRDLKSA
ncbi:MAG: hypothetical protein U0527_07300 [Candidatus Eisenbacteria bacterium]